MVARLAILGPLDPMMAEGLAAGMGLHGRWRLEWFPYRGGTLRRLRRRPPEALLVYGGDAQIFTRLAWFAGPVVNFSGVLATSPVPRVCWDNQAAGRLAAEHFLQRRQQHCAFIGYQGPAFSQEREAGFVATLAASGLRPSVWRVPGPAVQRPGGPAGLRRWLAGLPRPLGIAACNDSLALSLSDLVSETGERIPEDVAILGCDDSALCHLGAVALSSIATPHLAIGRTCIAVLGDLVAGRPVAQENRVAPGPVIRRASSDGPAIADPRLATALAWIRSHCHDAIGVGDLVAALPMGRRTLEQLCRRELGHGPRAEIERQRIDLARSLLADADLKLETIAQRCGFRDRHRFTAVFSRLCGLGPASWRQAQAAGSS